MKPNTLRLPDYWKWTLLFIMLLKNVNLSHAQVCGQPYLQTCSTSASLSRVAFTGCDDPDPPTYYLQQTYSSSYSPVSGDEYANYSYSQTYTMDPVHGGGAYSYTGSVDGVGYSGSYSATMDATTGVWSDGGTNAADSLSFQLEVWSMVIDSAVWTDECTATVALNGATGSDGSGDSTTATVTTSVSEEYTEDMLKSNIKLAMPDYSTNWTSGCGTAFWHWGDANHVSASGGKMKYRFYVTNTQLHQTYKIKWNEITTSADGSASSSAMSTEVAGNGDPVNGVYTATKEVAMPSSDSTISEVFVSISVESQGQGGS